MMEIHLSGSKLPQAELALLAVKVRPVFREDILVAGAQLALVDWDLPVAQVADLQAVQEHLPLLDIQGLMVQRAA
jgi:hypothetical protein